MNKTEAKEKKEKLQAEIAKLDKIIEAKSETVISTRVSSELKGKIEFEALALGLNISNYLKLILANRKILNKRSVASKISN